MNDDEAGVKIVQALQAARPGHLGGQVDLLAAVGRALVRSYGRQHPPRPSWQEEADALSRELAPRLSSDVPPLSAVLALLSLVSAYLKAAGLLEDEA